MKFQKLRGFDRVNKKDVCYEAEMPITMAEAVLDSEERAERLNKEFAEQTKVAEEFVKEQEGKKNFKITLKEPVYKKMGLVEHASRMTRKQLIESQLNEWNVNYDLWMRFKNTLTGLYEDNSFSAQEFLDCLVRFKTLFEKEYGDELEDTYESLKESKDDGISDKLIAFMDGDGTTYLYKGTSEDRKRISKVFRPVKTIKASGLICLEHNDESIYMFKVARSLEDYKNELRRKYKEDIEPANGEYAEFNLFGDNYLFNTEGPMEDEDDFIDYCLSLIKDSYVDRDSSSNLDLIDASSLKIVCGGQDGADVIKNKEELEELLSNYSDQSYNESLKEGEECPNCGEKDCDGSCEKELTETEKSSSSYFVIVNTKTGKYLYNILTDDYKWVWGKDKTRANRFKTYEEAFDAINKESSQGNSGAEYWNIEEVKGTNSITETKHGQKDDDLWTRIYNNLATHLDINEVNREVPDTSKGCRYNEIRTDFDGNIIVYGTKPEEFDFAKKVADHYGVEYEEVKEDKNPKTNSYYKYSMKIKVPTED